MRSRPLVKLERLARQLQIDPEWLRDQADRGLLPALRVGEDLFFDGVNVPAYLAERSYRTATVELDSLRDTARYIGVSAEELRGMAERGEVPAFRLGSRWAFQRQFVGSLLLRRVMREHEERREAGARPPVASAHLSNPTDKPNRKRTPSAHLSIPTDAPGVATVPGAGGPDGVQKVATK